MGPKNRAGMRRLLRAAVVGAASASVFYGGADATAADLAGATLAGTDRAQAGATAAGGAGAHTPRPGAVIRERPQTRRLAAREVRGGLKVTLTATRISTYDAYVYLNTYRWKGDGWHRVDRQRVRRGWFWYVLTAKDGVCAFVVRPLPRRHANVDVSLVTSGSVGCSPIYHYTVPR
jgi:hypothetical protein